MWVCSNVKSWVQVREWNTTLDWTGYCSRHHILAIERIETMLEKTADTENLLNVEKIEWTPEEPLSVAEKLYQNKISSCLKVLLKQTDLMYSEWADFSQHFRTPGKIYTNIIVLSLLAYYTSKFNRKRCEWVVDYYVILQLHRDCFLFSWQRS